MSNELIIGVDPGLHCGFALLDNDDFEVWEFSPMEACDRLYNILTASKRYKHARVSVERYNITGSTAKTNQTDALEIIGAMRWICRRANVTFNVVGSSDAAKIGTRANLVKLGWWRPGKPDHYQRASAQVAYAYMMAHPSEFYARTHS